ncbi:hypothetical protein FWF48_01885 [Candidatus Saccharibacteria bacterium]|nr:hypothetical protein [Candidatus Saccharibacteria bacterium]
MSKRSSTKFKSGAVSLYVVIFTTLLISVITVSFIRIMISERQHATNTDLSASAYDSAMAGVEDAKVALLDLANQGCINDPNHQSCNELISAMYNDKTGPTNNCDVVSILTGIGTAGQETKVQTSQTSDDTSTALNQAYTCVTINPFPNNYEETAEVGKSVLIPLTTKTGATTSFKLSWFDKDKDNNGEDKLCTGNVGAEVQDGSAGKLYSYNDWDAKSTTGCSNSNPSLMRLQIIQVNNAGFTLGGNDNSIVSHTMFLYPTISPAGTKSIDGTKDYTAPIPVACLSDYTSGGKSYTYACNDITITGLNSTGGTTTYVRLTSMYHNAYFSLSPYDGSGNNLQFQGVQSVVDSTGRANDLYRRVEARVELRSNTLFPEFAVDLGGSGNGAGDGKFCKDYVITDTGQSQNCN